MSVRNTAVVLALVGSSAGAIIACEEDEAGAPNLAINGGLGDGGGGGTIDAALGPGEKPPAGAAGDFCQKTLGVVGDALDTCCTADDKTTSDYAFTRRIVAALLPACSSALDASIAKSRVSYRAGAAASCFAAYQQTYSPDKCANVTQTFADPAGTSCRDAFAGVGGAGAPCMGDHECVDGLTCVGYTKSTDGTCKPPPAAGEECGAGPSDGGAGASASLEFGSHPECALGSRCDGSTHRCVKAAGDGEACSATSSCAAALHCVMGKCGPNGPGGEGSKCLQTDDCTPDTYCLGASGPSTPGTCTAKKSAGGSCTGSTFVTECVGRCDAPSGQPGTCKSFCGSP